MTSVLHQQKVAAVDNSGLYVALGAVSLPLAARRARGIAPPVSASGSGWSEEAAVRSMEMEAAERYSAEFDGTEELADGTPAEAECDPGEYLLFSEAQYESGEVPARLRPDQSIEWAMGRSLVDGSPAALPAGVVYLDYSFEGEPRYNVADTSGCAAAESMEAATQHALLEAIERDAVAIWWYNRIARPVLRDEAAEALRQVLEANGRNLVLFDLTHDLGIPVVAATSADSRGGAIYVGAAADLSPARAAERAARELMQFWYWDQAQGRVGRRRQAWIEGGSYEAFPFLDPRNAPAPAAIAHGCDPTEALAPRGLRAYVVDLTRAAIGIPVVRVLVPGLRQNTRRLAPGRLYDVPVALGWLAAPTPEADCNPYGVPI